MKRVGWMPWVTKAATMEPQAIGPWPAWSGGSKADVSREMGTWAQGFKYVLVPIFAEPPKKRRGK